MSENKFDKKHKIIWNIQVNRISDFKSWVEEIIKIKDIEKGKKNINKKHLSFLNSMVWILSNKCSLFMFFSTILFWWLLILSTYIAKIKVENDIFDKLNQRIWLIVSDG